MDKLLSKLSLKELLQLPGLSHLTNSYLRDVRSRAQAAVNNIRGARVSDYIRSQVPEAPAPPVALPKYIESEEYRKNISKARAIKVLEAYKRRIENKILELKADNEFFKNLKSTVNTKSKFSELTSIEKYQNRASYYKFYHKYQRMFKQESSIEIDLSEKQFFHIYFQIRNRQEEYVNEIVLVSSSDESVVRVEDENITPPQIKIEGLKSGTAMLTIICVNEPSTTIELTVIVK